MKNSPLKWLWEVTGKYRFSIFILLAVQILTAVSSVSSAWILKSVINSAAEHDRKGFFIYAAVFAAVILFQIILAAAGRYLQEYSKSGAENRFKERLFGYLMKGSYEDITAVHSAEWMNRLTSDTAVAADGVTVIVPELTGMIIKLAGALVSLILLIPQTAVIMIPGGILLVVFTYSFRKLLKKLHKNIQESDGRLRVFMTERLSSLMVVKIFSAEDSSSELAAEKMQDHRETRMKRMRFSNICNTGFALIMRGVYLAGAVYCGYGILVGSVSYGTFTAVLQLINQVQSPFANITGYLPKYYAMTASAERLMEAEKYAPDCVSEQMPQNEINQFYRDSFLSLVFENVDFSYSSSSGENPPQVLEKFSLEIFRGSYTAFTGHSGCGKSTVLKLMTSLYKETSGRRFIRTRDGDMPLDSSFRKLFSYVPQGNYLMNGTIREIVAFSDREKMKDSEKINHALKISCADEFISELSDGTDTLLGEHGTGLSEGQMQRIAIARAVFSDAPVMLLDEATSSLDEDTERRVLENLKKMTDKTVVIVTHRPAALEICSRTVCFSEKNTITENIE